MGVRPFVPGDVERLEAPLRRPHMVPDDSDEIVKHDDLPHARHSPNTRVVDICNLAAEHRTTCERRNPHVRRPGVDAVNRLAVDLVRRVEPLQRTADQPEGVRRLERRILRRCEAGSGVDEFAVAGLSAALVVKDFAVGRPARRRLDTPLRRRGFDEQRAGGGARDPHRPPEGADRGGAAGHLEAEQRIGIESVVRRRGLDADAVERSVQLLRDHHRKRRIDALAHLDLRNDQSGRAVATDPHEGVRREGQHPPARPAPRLFQARRRKAKARRPSRRPPARPSFA